MACIRCFLLAWPMSDRQSGRLKGVRPRAQLLDSDGRCASLLRSLRMVRRAYFSVMTLSPTAMKLTGGQPERPGHSG